MTVVEAIVKDGGTIIMVFECRDRLTHKHFRELMELSNDPRDILECTGINEPLRDKLGAQILTKVMSAHIILVSDKLSGKALEKMNLTRAKNIDEAFEEAEVREGPTRPWSASNRSPLHFSRGSVDGEPPTLVRIFFWFLLGLLSVFFAEVVSGSDMFPYFTIWGLLVTFPLYTLHTIVLLSIIFKYGKPFFYTLYPAGAIYGLYEAYITKVLWKPTWGPPIISIGGIAVIETMVLVFWWHPFMSFIIPSISAENLLIGSNYILSNSFKRFIYILEGRSERYAVIMLFAVLCGCFQGSVSPSPLSSLLSGLSTTSLITLTVYLWSKTLEGNKYSFESLLPSKTCLMMFTSALIFLYLFLGFELRPEALPNISSHIIIWFLYGFLILLLYRGLKKSRAKQRPSLDSLSIFSLKTWIAYSIVFTSSSTLTKLFMSPYCLGIIMMAWIAGISIGIVSIALTVKSNVSQIKA